MSVAETELDWDITDAATSQPNRPIARIFRDEVPRFSKYRLAKAYLRWTRDRSADNLTSKERDAWQQLIDRVNKALR